MFSIRRSKTLVYEDTGSGSFNNCIIVNLSTNEFTLLRQTLPSAYYKTNLQIHQFPENGPLKKCTYCGKKHRLLIVFRRGRNDERLFRDGKWRVSNNNQLIIRQCRSSNGLPRIPPRYIKYVGSDKVHPVFGELDQFGRIVLDSEDEDFIEEEGDGGDGYQEYKYGSKVKSQLEKTFEVRLPDWKKSDFFDKLTSIISGHRFFGTQDSEWIFDYFGTLKFRYCSGGHAKCDLCRSTRNISRVVEIPGKDLLHVGVDCAYKLEQIDSIWKLAGKKDTKFSLVQSCIDQLLLKMKKERI